MLHLGFEQGGRRNRIGLGHPPALDDPDPPFGHEPLDHRSRNCRAAAEEGADRGHIGLGVGLEVLLDAQPHRGDTGAEGHLLVLKEPNQALRGEVRPGIGEFGSLGDGHEGITPCRGMEHRDHGQHVVRGCHRVVGQVGDGVQVGGALGVGHPLRITGRARGVTEHHRRSLVELGPGPMLRRLRDQVLVCDGTGDALVRLRSHHHITHNGLHLGDDRCQQRDQIGIDEKDPVAGVVHDVGDLIGKETDVDRVADQARVGGRPVELVVTPVVPGKRGDRITLDQAEAAEC